MKLRQLSAMLIGFALTGMAVLSVSAQEQEQGTDKTQIRILATSDLHGKFFPWDYIANEENRSGSMTQLASAIAEYRTENTLLVDGGDTIQDNESDQFLDSEDAHPMIGMVTPNITLWDAENLKNCTVTDPLAETRTILDEIEGQYDLLVGVVEELDGVVVPEVDNNWKLTGYEWDEEKHALVGELVKEGKLELKYSEDGRTPNVRSFTEEELSAALEK